jgi:hypothetical protein
MTKNKDYPQSYQDAEALLEEALSERTVEMLNEARMREHQEKEDPSQLIMVVLISEGRAPSVITSMVEYGDGTTVARAIEMAHQIEESMLAPEESIEIRCHDIDMNGAIKDSYVIEVQVIHQGSSSVN